MTRTARTALSIGLVAVALTTAAAALWPSYDPAGPGATPSPDLTGLAVGEMAGVVIHETPVEPPQTPFSNEAGEQMRFADFEGQVTLVNFWATWCAPCLREMPSIDRLAKALQSDAFHVAVLSVDAAPPEKSRAFLDDIEADSLTLYLEPTMQIARDIGAVGLPMTLLLDRDGREIARLMGHAEWDSPEAIELVRTAIGAPDA